jgi:hypothetical protein
MSGARDRDREYGNNAIPPPPRQDEERGNNPIPPAPNPSNNPIAPKKP